MKVNVGDRIPEWVMERVSPARMRTMAAILRDPNPLHWDRKVVERLGLGERTINQGPLGVSYMVNMLHAWAGENCIRRIVVRFPNPVILDEDRIVACGAVAELSESNGVRLAECHVWLERDGEAGLIEGTATVCLP
jgi:acyl dehydratase